MARYSKPVIDVLYFDEEEIEAATASTLKARYSADLMNEFFLNSENDAKQTTTVRIQNVNVTVDTGENQ